MHVFFNRDSFMEKASHYKNYVFVSLNDWWLKNRSVTPLCDSNRSFATVKFNLAVFHKTNDNTLYISTYFAMNWLCELIWFKTEAPFYGNSFRFGSVGLKKLDDSKTHVTDEIQFLIKQYLWYREETKADFYGSRSANMILENGCRGFNEVILNLVAFWKGNLH